MRQMTFAMCSCLAFALPLPAQTIPQRGTPVDRAIDRALEFLHHTQSKSDGSWNSGRGKHVAVASFAVMAFLSAGHVPGEGPYGATVERGVRWVLAQQQPNGLLASDGNHEMYHHGIATLMLAEVAGMTDGELAREVRRRLVKAIDVILKAQRPGPGPDGGGWRYRVAHVGGSDISITGWQIMALRAAKNLGCDVPVERIDRAIAYVKRCHDPGSGGYRYTVNSRLTPGCTGASVLSLELCGRELHKSPEVVRAGTYLLKKENMPRWGGTHFFYQIYYASQALFQLGDNFWNVFRPKLHEVLLRNQQSNGSWTGGDSDAHFGPNYCTSMAVLSLTVEYRFLPIYQRGEEPTDK